MRRSDPVEKVVAMLQLLGRGDDQYADDEVLARFGFGEVAFWWLNNQPCGVKLLSRKLEFGGFLDAIVDELSAETIQRHPGEVLDFTTHEVGPLAGKLRRDDLNLHYPARNPAVEHLRKLALGDQTVVARDQFNEPRVVRVEPQQALAEALEIGTVLSAEQRPETAE